MFDLKRPCSNCPFRKDIGETFRLPKERIIEIAMAPAFQCHKTVDYDAWEDGGDKSGDRPQQCAGLMSVLHRDNIPNQIMQVAERLGQIDPEELDPRDEAYASLYDVIEAHCGGQDDRG